MKLGKLVLISALTLSSISAFGFTRVKNAEGHVSNLIHNIINKGSGTCADLGGVPFASKSTYDETKELSQSDDIPGACGGEIAKLQKDGVMRVVIKGSQCTNLVLGLNVGRTWYSAKSFSAKSDSQMRAYKMKQGETLNLQVSKKLLDSDNQVYALFTSNSGKNCSIVKLNYR